MINIDQSEARRRGSSFQELGWGCDGSFMGILRSDWSIITHKVLWLVNNCKLYMIGSTAFYGCTCHKAPKFLRIFSHLLSVIIIIITLTLIIKKCWAYISVSSPSSWHLPMLPTIVILASDVTNQRWVLLELTNQRPDDSCDWCESSGP